MAQRHQIGDQRGAAGGRAVARVYGAPPEISVDPGRAVPPYEQVRQQIADLIVGGVIPAGTRLPPVRQLAADLGLAAGTVARAYQELESAGLVRTRRGAGTLVLARDPAHHLRAALLANHARAYLAETRRLGISDTDALAAVRAQLGR